MSIPSLSKNLCGVVLGLCLAFAFALPARADDAPKVANAEARELLKKFRGLVEAEITAFKAKDRAKAKEIDAKIDALMQGSDTLSSKVSPEENEDIRKYILSMAQKIEDARKDAAK